MYDQPQMDGAAESKCYACGYSSVPPSSPKVSHRGEGTRYEPRLKGQALKTSTNERNKYGAADRAR